MRRSLVYFIIASITLSMIGCTSTVKLTRLRPAEINLISYKKIAIGGISGQGGDEVGSLLTQALFDSKKYEVLDRENLLEVMREHNLAFTGYFDPTTTVKLGKMIGSSALIFGKVLRRDYGQKEGSSKTTCVDMHGHKSVCYEYSVTGTWKLNIDFQLVDVSTGKILASYTNPYSTDKVNQAQNERAEANWDVNEVFSELSKDAVDDFMKKIAPYQEEVKVKIFTDSDLPELKMGLNYAKQDDWNSAIERFRTACTRADNDPDIKDKIRARAHYDLGIALGYSGVDYNRAISELQKAASINPEDVFYTEQSKIKQFKSDETRLKEQGAGKKTSLIIKLIPTS